MWRGRFLWLTLPCFFLSPFGAVFPSACPHSWLSPQKAATINQTSKWVICSQRALWAHKVVAGGNVPLGNQVDSKHSLSITNEFKGNGVTPAWDAKSVSKAASHHPLWTCFPFCRSPSPLLVYKHVYKYLIGDLIYLVTCGFIYLEISR